MQTVYEILAKVTDPVPALLMIAVTVLVYLNTKHRLPKMAWTVVLAVVAVLGLSLLSRFFFVDHIYHLRVTVKDPQGRVMHLQARDVWVSGTQSEPKPVETEWQFDMPEAALPQDHKITVHARSPVRSLEGETVVLLGDDRNPNVTLALPAAADARITGIVIDRAGRAVPGAKVFAISSGTVVTTDDTGRFALDAKVPEGQLVALHTEKTLYRADNGNYTAGELPVTITLERAGQK